MKRLGQEDQAEHTSEVAKEGAKKKAGLPAGMAGASTFGGSKSTSVQVGFSGKLQSKGSSKEGERERTDATKFASATVAHGSSSGGGKKSRRKRVMPKLLEPKGEQNCDNASSLQLCTWL
jgi:hypothetical protein